MMLEKNAQRCWYNRWNSAWKRALLYNNGIIIIFIVLSACMDMQSHQSNTIVIYWKN